MGISGCFCSSANFYISGKKLYSFADIFFFSLLVISPVFGLSQIKTNDHFFKGDYFQVGLDAGATVFFGDVDNGPANGGLLKNNTAFKLHVGRNFSSLLLVNGQVSFGRVSGKKSSNDVYWYFKCKFIEYTFGVGINIVGLFKDDLNNLMAFYANFGIGLIDIRSNRYNGHTQNVVQTFGYGDQKATTEMVIPLGGSLIFNISPHSSLSIQSTISRVDTDKMDALEGNDNRDYYNYTSIGYIYKIFSDRKRSISRTKPPAGNRK